MKGEIESTRKKKAIHRLKIIEGAVRGLMKMVENEEYCIEILTQSLSLQESLKSFDAVMLENHLHCHVVKQMRSKDTAKPIKELLKLYKLHKKS